MESAPEAASSAPAAIGTANRGVAGRSTHAYPANATQRRLWFADRAAGLAGSHLVPTVLEFAGPVDAEALRAAP